MLLTLLMYVLILGVIAWVVNAIPMPEPFKLVAWGILIIILIIVLFRAIPSLGLP
jgi:hypothetical protein